MSEPINDPGYWAQRLKEAQHLHQSIYLVTLPAWQAIEANHKKVLAKHLLFADDILDVGCGYGRLVSILPKTWKGRYLGVDHSKEFLDIAIENWKDKPTVVFVEGDFFHLEDNIKHLIRRDFKFDIAVLISIRGMIIRELGQGAWDELHCQLKAICKKVLYLEYDPQDEGELEICQG